jgi:hypothetical protein
MEWNLAVIEDFGDKEQLHRQHKAITALREALAEPEPCRYPDCVDNGPDGKCTRWLVDECSMREDYKRYRPAKPLPPIGKASTDVGGPVQEPPVVARNVLLGMIASRPAQQAEPFSPEAISTTQTAWKMGFEVGKAEAQALQDAVVSGLGISCGGKHIDPTSIYKHPEIKDDKPFGYFRAEPFGWTDCATTDEGAIPLYERPQGKLLPWKGLTEEEHTYYKACGFVGVKAVEEKLRARNSTLVCHQGEEGK